MTDHLRAQDATLWNVQTADAPLQIGALCLLEAAPLHDGRGRLRLDDLRHHVESRLVPRFRQRLLPLPLDQGVVWVDDERFDIGHHVRGDTLAAPGGDAQLRRLVASLLERPLDPDRPLWEMHLVDGVAGDRVALVVKASHVMVDGMALLELSLSLLDAEPVTRRRRRGQQAEPWSPRRPPPTGVLLASAVVGRTMRQGAALWQLGTRVADPRLLVRAATGLGRRDGNGRFAPPLPVTVPVGARRDFGWTRLPLDDLLAARTAEAATLNDVVLAVCGGGLARYLARHGSRGGRDAKVLVPVSSHARPGEEVENRFALIVTDLHLDAPDARARLRAIHADMEAHKQAQADSLGPLLFSLAELIPPRLLRAAGPPALRHQPLVNLAVTNLPGSRQPGFLLGARLLELFPFVSGVGNISLIIGVLSYEDGLGVGVTVDAAAVPDVGVLVSAIEDEARELVEAIGT